ncbi:hypothetical protein [Caulobacter hibisci]|uniref:Uncharacterized protein n=1 Tax=Caulobacter hibisci TaxID=2035993 RepID=A0ABS0T4X8_9CAUL|nr:hypothetical protein [Caulobacter hibisci]MBI1685897.1 hypothetical protein [Caulobacter hibisci]
MLVASILFHAALLAALAHYKAPPPRRDEKPPLEVSLISPSRSQRDARPAERSPQTPRPHVAPQVPATPATVAPPAPVGPAAPAPSPAGTGEDAIAARVRQALGGRRGCERAGLTREARERCQAQQWAGVAPADPRLNLDPTGRFARAPEPFLSRRPKDGCRARLTGDADGMGNDSNARAGVTCVVPF